MFASKTLTTKSALILTTAAAIALSSFDLRPAAAAPEGGAPIAKQNSGDTDLSAARKRRRGRGVNPAIPLAAFGAIAGTIAGIAASERRRDTYYYDDGPYYGGPGYAPRVYNRPHYVQPNYGYRGAYVHQRPYGHAIHPQRGPRFQAPGPAVGGGNSDGGNMSPGH